MPRKQKAKQTETLVANPEDSPAPGPEGQALLAALRSNLSLLGELAMRYEVETRPERSGADLPSINTPHDVYDLLGPEMAALAQEQLRVLLLDRRNRVLGQRTVYQGNVFSSVVRPAEVFRAAVVESLPAVIVAHNHPSGAADPSPEDVSITKDLAKAGKLLGIELLDHVVIGCKTFVSLKERGLMP